MVTRCSRRPPAAYFLVYTTNLGHLPTSFDYLSILSTTLPLVFVAVGQSLVVLTGGIDLSVGGIVALCVAITATTVDGAGVTPYLWILMVLALGAAGGGINGLIVAKARIAPILTTLASLSIFSGLALWVLPVPGGNFPPEVRLVLTNPSVPTGLIWLGLVIAGWLVLRRTRFGMRVYAVGSDEASALAVGVPAASVKVGVYALSGLCSALAGVSTYPRRRPETRTRVGRSSSPRSLRWWSVTSPSAAAGAVRWAPWPERWLLTLVIDVLFFAGIDPLYQSLFQGLFLVVAVLLGTGAALIGRLRRGAS